MKENQTFGKFRLLLWKNFTLKRRKPCSTICELVLPVFLCLLACLLMIVTKTEHRKALVYDAKNVRDATKAPISTVFWSPCNNPALGQIMQKVIAKLHKDGTCVNNSMSLDYVLRYATKNGLVGVQFPNSLSNSGNLTKTMKITLRFPPDYRWSTNIQYPPELQNDVRAPNSTTGGPPYYFDLGFLMLQCVISWEILRNNENQDLPTIQLRRFPYPDKEVNTIGSASPLLVLFLFLGFGCIYSHVLRNVAVEKERQIKEIMKIMGLTSWLHWASWYTTTLLLSLIPITLIVVLLTVPLVSENAVLPLTSPIILFVFLLLFVSAVTIFAFAVSVFFSTASIASAIGNIMFFLMYFPHALTRASSYANKLASCLVCGTAFASGMEVVTSYEAKSKSLNFDTLFEPIYRDEVSLGLVMLMLILDSVVYLLIALYVDAIFPGKYGLARVWYFPFTSEFWHGNTAPIVESVDDNFIHEENYYEKEPSGAKIGIKILHLHKRYGKDKVILQNLSLNMFEDTVTVLLGYNGAGKTTTMSILTGIQRPSGGTAFINGHDIRTDMNEIRKNLGFCPQDNVLFDDLTVREHFYFYCKLKGMTKNIEVKAEVEKYLRVLDLNGKRQTRCKKLSGGMKRRVCIGIALCANSKVCIFDEPTSGLDPIARRNVWNTIRAEKSGRTILLTTHFMNEADVLGDRIAILANGVLKCYGTSFFLKKNYGSGYRLVIVKSKQCDVKGITELLNSYISEIHVETDVGSELTYILPENKTSNFESMLGALEGHRDRLGIESYGISLASIEEVFMKVGAEADTSDENYDIEKERKVIQNKNYLTGFALYMNQFLSMLIKKALATRKSWVLFLVHIILPLVFVILYLEQMKEANSEMSSPELLFTLNSYPKSVTVVSTDDSNNRYYKRYKQILDKENKKYIDWGTSDMIGRILASRKEDNNNVRRNYLIGATFLKNDTIVAWFNDWPLHAPPLAVQYAINAVIKERLSADHSIQFSNHPAPPNAKKPEGNDNFGNALVIAILMGALIPYLTSYFVIFCVKEKACDFKHLQLVSGATVTIFWLAAFLWDFIIFMGITCCLMLVMAIYKAPIAYGVFVVLLMAYAFASIPSMYVLSLFFKRSSTAYAVASMTIFFTGLFGFLALDMSMLSTRLGNAFSILCLCVPYYNFVIGVRNISNRYIINDACIAITKDYAVMLPNATEKGGDIACMVMPDVCCDTRYYSDNCVGKNMIILLLIGLILILFLFTYEIRLGYNLIYKWLTSCVHPPFFSEKVEDADVQQETERVRNGEITKTNNKVVLKDTTKYYNRFLAVNQLCLGVKEGECFGLVGVNGAGKTTTLKMLIGEEPISKGDAWVSGQSLMGRLSKVRRNMGYCPQFDALYEDFTGQEILLIFCLLKGYRWNDCKLTISILAHQFRFTKHLNKKVAHYSGGNKRKLNTAIALLGEPTVIFLDEPSTGMDPGSKHHFWNTLCSIRDSGRCIILITHYMDECEAICTRLAIMVNGVFQCLGSPQHIKSKFADGYVLIVKVRRPTNGGSTASDLEEVDKFVKINFPTATVRESHDTLVTYVIKDVRMPWSRIFGIMERGKKVVKVIEDYSISQFDLEQIFLHFTKSQVTVTL